MNGYERELHIEDELFEGVRKDADRVLQKLLKNMVEKGSLEGKVTIGIDVTFTQEFIPNRDPNIDGETRRTLTPKFSHKVGSVMQIKDEVKGDRNCDGTELVFDEERGEYVLRPISNTDQMTIFDAEFHCVNDPGEDESGNGQCYQPALAGRGIAELPGHIEAEDDGAEDISDTFGMNPPEDMPFAEDDDEYDYDDPDGE